MRKLRLEFQKKGPSIYISHLDLMRTFQRAFQRAKLPIRHTEGFNPHAFISIALPMSVGFQSDCELLDFQLLDETPMEEVVVRLNAVLPAGIVVIACREARRSFRELVYVRYQIELLYDQGVPENAKGKIEALLQRNSLMIEKKGKKAGRGKALVLTNIAPLIQSASLTQERNVLRLDTVLRAQEPGINPRYLIKAIEQYEGEACPDFFRCHRKAIYDSEMKIFL